MARMSMERTKDVYPTICMLQELAEVEETWHLCHLPAGTLLSFIRAKVFLRWQIKPSILMDSHVEHHMQQNERVPTQAQRKVVGGNTVSQLTEAWGSRLHLMRNERFELVEPFFALRQVLLTVRVP